MAQTKVKLVSNGVITVDNLHTNHGITTDHIGEGTNKFFTDARVQSYLASNNYIKTTDVASLETTTSLSLNANILSYVDEAGATTNIDLSLYLDDTNLARLVSGTLNSGTGIATFTRDDATTFTVDFSAFLSDANDYVTSASFNTTNGVLTLTRLGGGTVTVDLDNRYLTSFTETDPIYTASSWYTTTNNSSNWNTAYGWGNHASAGYLTSFTESDPTVPAHVKSITSTNISNWNTAYGWGNHASAGYLTSYSETDTLATVTARGATTNSSISVNGDITVLGNQVITAGDAADVKFSVWSGTTYGIGMTPTVTLGGLNDYAMTFCMNNDTDRGFWWGYSGQAKSAGAMSLTTAGHLTVTSRVDTPILYDYSNTGYYTDPASTSVLNAIQISTVSSAPSITLEGTRGMMLTGVSSIGMRTVTDTWTDPNYHGIRSTSTAAGWSDDISINSYHDITMRIDSNGNNADGAFRIYTDTTSSSNLRFFFDYAGTGQATGSFRAPIFYYSDDTNSYFDANRFVLRGTDPTVIFRDTNHNSAMLHCNSNLFYILRGANDTTTWTQVGGQWPAYWNLTNNELRAGGAGFFVGDVTANTSDERLKENVKPIENALEKVKSINGVTFDWKDNLEEINYTRQKIHDVGVIAQEVQKVLPEIVVPAPFDTDEDGNSRSGDNYLTVQYEKIVPLLIEAIKEQQKQIEELKQLIKKQ